MGYAIAQDTSTSTAIVNISNARYDQGDNLQLTQTSSYRMAADGTLTLLSIDVQASAFADPKQTRLFYTAKN